MSHFTDRYYPTICIRRAEMRALSKLPSSEKEKMLPIILLAPWLNSIKFDNTIKTIEKNLGDIPMIMDLDRYFQSTSELPSRIYFKSLLDGSGFFEKWTKLLEDNENYIPAIQIFNKSEDEIDQQIKFAKELNRGFAFRFEIERNYDYDLIYEKISENQHEDTITIFDNGYGNDRLEEESKIYSLVDRLINISEKLKFVISTSNFPNDFSAYDDFAQSQPIGARRLYSELENRFGNYNIYYGDWASTKPRRYDGGGSKPKPRIDFPTRTKWIIARSKEENWDFTEAARRITRLPEWQDRPIIWGTGMIEKTAADLPHAIATGPESIAVRVNIHLFVQNNYKNPNTYVPPSTDWVDPI